MDSQQNQRSLLKKLFEYIEEQAKDIDPHGYNLSLQNEFLCEPKDIAGLPGIEVDLKKEGDHVWLSVERLESTPFPKPPKEIFGFVKISEDPTASQPSFDKSAYDQLVSRVTKGKAESERITIEQKYKAVTDQLFLRYVDEWTAWSVKEKPRRRTIRLYGELFSLKQKIEAGETARPTDFVWGIGVGAWKIPYPKEGPVIFKYPLLTQLVELSINEKTMTIEIRPRATDTRVELDALIECGVIGSVEAEKTAREHLAKNIDCAVTPFDSGSYTDVLMMMAGNLDSKGQYQETLHKNPIIPTPGEHLLITDIWVIFSRPRKNNFLIDDIKALQKELASECDIPAGPRAIVSPPSETPTEFHQINFRGVSSRGTGAGEPKELFFPLPYNDEQVTIVQRLEQSAGVTVQGPPGTGKTHTIANIICHYLATGRRVLVTSKGEPALAVIQSKIPEEVRSLTVALLSGDREGMRQFQTSIEAIQHQVSQLNVSATREEIKNFEKEIEHAHAELQKIDRRIDEIALTQLSNIEIDGEPMRAQKLAKTVVSGQADFGWFDDSLTLSSEHTPPLNSEEGAKLREVRRTLGKDIVYIQFQTPSADNLVPLSQIADLHMSLCKAREIHKDEQSGKLMPLKAFNAEVIQSARDLLRVLDEALILLSTMEAQDGGWPIKLREKCREQAFSSERQALEAMFRDFDSLSEARAKYLQRPVELPEGAISSPQTRKAILRAALTGKPFSLISIGASEAKSHISSIKVSGLPPANIDDWKHVNDYVALHEKLLSFTTRWNQLNETMGMPHLECDLTKLRNIELVTTAAKNAHTMATQYDVKLPRHMTAVFHIVPNDKLLAGTREINDIKLQVTRQLSRLELAGATVALETFHEKLAGMGGPITKGLREFLDKYLGNPSVEANKLISVYSRILAELRRLSSLSSEIATLREFLLRIESAGAVRFAARLRATPVLQSGEDSALPVNWKDAWRWARLRGHLESIEAREELISLSTKRMEVEAALSRLYKVIVSKSAWLATKGNSSPKVLQALSGYATAIRRIGQGFGPNASRYRRDAREAMVDAERAVPCWIMSHSKISESIPAEIGTFDLVIVDEASQSDLWALPAIVRGKKILVVGDDKQVSPSPGFKSAQWIEELKKRFLQDQPYGTEMTPEKSLYDLAARVFASEQVMLREHFRCVPAIIGYSNREFYKGGIQPLRIPKASERIDPPLVDIFVDCGVRNGKDINAREAEAIADEIEEILQNKQFVNRTIGVVTLLGGIEQAKQIDSLVRERCSSIELYHRKFECGDPSTFQGSERDIMFISMVADKNNCRALSGLTFEQRFNVAASRARDRMYLVRSVTASELSEKDLRLTLIQHFDKPIGSNSDEAKSLINLCESGFEKDVYSELVKRGYQVTPQVKSGAYRIDMVVEGAHDNRLAIECDGDEFHGPDRWRQDMSRQRVLERAGWVFWRCFASTWVSQKENIIEELVARLNAMGIEPLGAIHSIPSLVEKRVWSAPQGENDFRLDEPGQPSLL